MTTSSRSPPTPATAASATQLPDPTAIASIPCSLGGAALDAEGNSARPKPPASYDQIFRDPDSVKQALKDSTR